MRPRAGERKGGGGNGRPSRSRSYTLPCDELFCLCARQTNPFNADIFAPWCPGRSTFLDRFPNLIGQECSAEAKKFVDCRPSCMVIAQQDLTGNPNITISKRRPPDKDWKISSLSLTMFAMTSHFRFSVETSRRSCSTPLRASRSLRIWSSLWTSHD